MYLILAKFNHIFLYQVILSALQRAFNRNQGD